MDSQSSASTCGINPATGEKQGGSGPLYHVEEPSYTITSSNTNIGMTINNSACTDSSLVERDRR